MDVWELLYHYLLLTPLRLLGRILWIAVDFVVIERTIIGSISQTTRFLSEDCTVFNQPSG